MCVWYVLVCLRWLPDLLLQIWQESTTMILPGIRLLFVLPLRQLLVEQSCISAFSDVPLVSFVLQTRHSLHSRFLLCFSHFMHIHIIYVWQCWMCCPLCFSGGGQGPLLSFLALVFLILPKKYIFFPPLAPPYYISLPLACGCFWFWQIKWGCQSNASLLYPLAALPVTGAGARWRRVEQHNNSLLWSGVAWGRSYVWRL